MRMNKFCFMFLIFSLLELNLEVQMITEKYPEMKPFVGSNYDSNEHKRLLIVGESHYLPDYSTVHLDPSKWYNGNSSLLDSDEKYWINTAELIEWSTHESFNKKGWSMYRNIHNALKESGLKSKSFSGENEYLFDEVAYMNYFKRPANKGNSIKQIFDPVDQEIAYQVFCDTVKNLKPDLIVIASRYVNQKIEEKEVWKFLKEMNCTYCHTPHPTSAYWNRKLNWKSFEGRTGKEQFIHFLITNRFFK